MGTSCDVMINKPDVLTIICEFDSHRVLHTSSFVLRLYISITF